MASRRAFACTSRRWPRRATSSAAGSAREERLSGGSSVRALRSDESPSHRFGRPWRSSRSLAPGTAGRCRPIRATGCKICGPTTAGRASGVGPGREPDDVDATVWVLLLRHTPTATPMELTLAWLPFEREALQRADVVDVSGMDMAVAAAQDHRLARP